MADIRRPFNELTAPDVLFSSARDERPDDGSQKPEIRRLSIDKNFGTFLDGGRINLDEFEMRSVQSMSFRIFDQSKRDNLSTSPLTLLRIIIFLSDLMD